MDFFNTVGGQRFVNGTVPQLVKNLEVIAQELKRGNDLKTAELQGGVKFQGDKAHFSVVCISENPLILRIDLNNKPLLQVNENGEVITVEQDHSEV